jgi:hypothetical protein
MLIPVSEPAIVSDRDTMESAVFFASSVTKDAFPARAAPSLSTKSCWLSEHIGKDGQPERASQPHRCGASTTGRKSYPDYRVSARNASTSLGRDAPQWPVPGVVWWQISSVRVCRSTDQGHCIDEGNLHAKKALAACLIGSALLAVIRISSSVCP